MKIIDKGLLQEFSGPGKCEICQKDCRRREPHHVRCRGMGGGSRLDIAINLIAVGGHVNGFPECPCHRLAQEGNISKASVLEIIGKREKLTPEEIEGTVNRLLRSDKNGKDPRAT